MPEASTPTSSPAPVSMIESPPASAQPLNANSADNPRSRLHRLAMQLLRTQNRRLLAEFLALRRAMR